MDFLLELSQSKAARELIKRLGLPLPMPERLVRGDGPWSERELAGRVVAVSGSGMTGEVAETLARDGADVRLVGVESRELFDRAGEAWSRVVASGVDGRIDGWVLDASSVDSPAGLKLLHELGSEVVAKLGRCSRVVVLGRPPESMAGAAGAAAQHALDGFVRSIGKEVGRRGGTAQRLLVAPGAEARLPAVLRWVLSARSAWMSLQTITIDAVAASLDEPVRVRPLAGHTAVVTGAARGIGAAMVKRLSEEGAHVIAVDRPGDEGPLSDTAREHGAKPLLLDVTAANAVEVLRAEGPIDVMIHNAGVTRDKTLARMSPAQWEQALAVNLEAVVRITDALVEEGLADHGRVVCLSSIAGIAGNFGQTNYSTAKAGIIGYVKALAPRVAARGITVNALAPGFVETRLTAAIPVMQREAGRRLAALGQGGEPVDVAELATFLASAGAVGITGQALRICGGNLVGA